MRIAVAGATGNIGARTASFLEREGHEVIRISRSLGVDLTTGEGLDAALEGVDAVVDAISSPPVGPDETREYFCTTTRNLLAAEQRAGVRHHVLLSIVGIHRIEGGTAHYSGKREQGGCRSRRTCGPVGGRTSAGTRRCARPPRRTRPARAAGAGCLCDVSRDGVYPPIRGCPDTGPSTMPAALGWGTSCRGRRRSPTRSRPRLAVRYRGC